MSRADEISNVNLIREKIYSFYENYKFQGEVEIQELNNSLLQSEFNGYKFYSAKAYVTFPPIEHYLAVSDSGKIFDLEKEFNDLLIDKNIVISNEREALYLSYAYVISQNKYFPNSVLLKNFDNIPYDAGDLKNPNSYDIAEPTIHAIENGFEASFFTWSKINGIITKWDIKILNNGIATVNWKVIDTNVGHYISNSEGFLVFPGQSNYVDFTTAGIGDGAGGGVPVQKVFANDTFIDIKTTGSSGVSVTSMEWIRGNISNFDPNTDVNITVVLYDYPVILRNINKTLYSTIAHTDNTGYASYLIAPPSESIISTPTGVGNVIAFQVSNPSKQSNLYDSQNQYLTIERVLENKTFDGLNTYRIYYFSANFGWDITKADEYATDVLNAALNAYRVEVGQWQFPFPDPDHISYITISDGIHHESALFENGLQFPCTCDLGGNDTNIGIGSDLINWLDPSSPYYYPSQSAMLRDIVGHEQFHNIQFGINSWKFGWVLVEGTARFAETVLEQDVNFQPKSLFYANNINGVNGYMLEPNRPLYWFMYDYALYWGNLYQNNGGMDTIRKIFFETNKVGDNVETDLPQAVSSVLQNVSGPGNSFDNSIDSFSRSVYIKNFTWGSYDGSNKKYWGQYMNDVTTKKINFINSSGVFYSTVYPSAIEFVDVKAQTSSNYRILFEGDSGSGFDVIAYYKSGVNFKEEHMSLNSGNIGFLNVNDPGTWENITVAVIRHGTNGYGYYSMIVSSQREHDVGVAISTPPNFIVKTGQMVNITSIIYNIGSSKETNVQVKFLADYNLIDEKIIDLESGESKTLNFNWITHNSGGHILQVYVVPLDSEVYKDDNLASDYFFFTDRGILLVDDDVAGNTNLNYYLNSISYTAGTFTNTWSTDSQGSPPLSELSKYDIVIWYTGRTSFNTLTHLDQENLKQYLDSGGKLFISGQDIGWDLIQWGDSESKSFYKNYLHANYVRDSSFKDVLYQSSQTVNYSFNPVAGLSLYDYYGNLISSNLNGLQIKGGNQYSISWSYDKVYVLFSPVSSTSQLTIYFAYYDNYSGKIKLSSYSTVDLNYYNDVNYYFYLANSQRLNLDFINYDKTGFYLTPKIESWAYSDYQPGVYLNYRSKSISVGSSPQLKLGDNSNYADSDDISVAIAYWGDNEYIGTSYKDVLSYNDVLILSPTYYSSSDSVMVRIPEWSQAIQISGGDGANNQLWPDEISPADPYTYPMFYYDNDGVGAVLSVTGTYRTVYFAFGFEGINNYNDRSNVMNTILSFFGFDFRPPVIVISNPPENSVTGQSTNLAINTNENAICKYSKNDTVFELMSNMFEVTGTTVHSTKLSNLADGTHILYVRCIDESGNRNLESEEVIWTVNSHLNAPFITSVNTNTFQTSKTVRLNITTNENSYCRYSSEGVGYDYMTNQFASGEGTSSHWVDVGAQEGINIFYASCSDTSGSSMTNAVPIIFSVDTSGNYNITVPLKKWWNSFFLPRIIIGTIDSLRGNYTVPNILSSISGNYQILYYHNGVSWVSYAPGRPLGLNDLTEFNDQLNKPYWINMNVADRIEIS